MAQIVFTAEAAERFAERAAARGVDEIGFTEHVYYFRQTRDLWDVPYQLERCVFDLEEYCGAVLEAKRRGLPIKLGLEVDYVGDRQPRLSEILEPYPWDFLLGSVHWLGTEAVDQDPGVGVWAESVGRRRLAALLRRDLRSSRGAARSTSSRISTSPRSSTGGRVPSVGRSCTGRSHARSRPRASAWRSRPRVSGSRWASCTRIPSCSPSASDAASG